MKLRDKKPHVVRGATAKPLEESSHLTAADRAAVKKLLAGLAPSVTMPNGPKRSVPSRRLHVAGRRRAA